VNQPKSTVGVFGACVFALCAWVGLGLVCSFVGGELLGGHGSVIVVLPALALCLVGGLVASGVLISSQTRYLPVLKQASISWVVSVTPIAAFFLYAAIVWPWSEASFVGVAGLGLATVGLPVAIAAAALGARVLHRAQGAA
jgi:hypothetical protein